MSDRWRIRWLKSRWWLLKPASHPQSWVAAHVGTYNECLDELARKLNRD